jgi:hypothetical protein
VLSLAAAAIALAALTVPYPEPCARPPTGWKTVLLVIDLRICWTVISGYRDLISATMPETTALAALVLLTRW